VVVTIASGLCTESLRIMEAPMALNVLVVDDSSVMRAMIIRCLRLSGLPVSEYYQAGNGKEGLAILEKQWIDVALVDLNMPVMSGEEMIHAIRQNPENANLSIVVISTEGSATRIGRLRTQGVEFVHKPFSPETLREIVVGVTGVQDADITESRTAESSGTDF